MVEDSNLLGTRVSNGLKYWVEVLERHFKTKMTQDFHDLSSISVEILSHVLVECIHI
jgi:hypothetical protein